MYIYIYISIFPYISKYFHIFPYISIYLHNFTYISMYLHIFTSVSIYVSIIFQDIFQAHMAMVPWPRLAKAQGLVKDVGNQQGLWLAPQQRQ